MHYHQCSILVVSRRFSLLVVSMSRQDRYCGSTSVDKLHGEVLVSEPVHLRFRERYVSIWLTSESVCDLFLASAYRKPLSTLGCITTCSESCGGELGRLVA